MYSSFAIIELNYIKVKQMLTNAYDPSLDCKIKCIVSDLLLL